ncbi:MAG: hypothetical protein N2Z74_04500 [Syntrophales bacterium]|nr:hypothetical protein [Syntrophales bacterium]
MTEQMPAGGHTTERGGKDHPPPGGYRARFESVGAVVPEGRLSTQDLMAGVRLWGRFDLEKLTGIRERRVCGDGEDSYTLSVAAARECLKYSSYGPEDLEMIICCSISRFKDGMNFVYEPPLSLYVKEAIGARGALHFDVANACAGMLTGVMIMNDFIKRGVIRRGMVISGECITSLSRNAVPRVKTILSSQLASLTLGDCGAAVIVERSSPGKAALTVSSFMTLARWSDLCIGKACKRAPGAEMDTDARKIHQVAIANMPTVLARALAEAGMSFADMDHLLPHQTSLRAIRSGEKHLRLFFGTPPKNIIVNMIDYGNTASTSHFLALYRFLKKRAFQPGEKLVLLALASGLVIGVVTFTMDELADRYGCAD